MTDFGMPTLIEIPDTEESVKLGKRLGLRFMELNMSFPQYQPQTMDVKALRDISDRYGIYYTIHIDESLDPCNVNPDIAEVYLNTMLQTVEIAKQLHVPTLNMHLLRGIVVTLPDRKTYIYAENEELYLSRLRNFRDRVTEAIGESGIKVCIENTDGFDLTFLRHGVDTLLESPAFMLTFDVGHDHAINGIDKPFIMERENRLYHMHLHDAVGTSVHLALGDGEMDKDGMIALAARHGCRVVLETKTVEALITSSKWTANYLNRQSDPGEVWDLYDAQRRPLGRTHLRGEDFSEGEYHLAVHIWTRNSKGEYLLTRRDPNKGFGGMWECTGGSAKAGENSLEAALREVREETGFELDAERGEVYLTYSRDHFICDVWLFRQDFDLSKASLLPGETTDIMYASPERIKELLADGEFVPYAYINDSGLI